MWFNRNGKTRIITDEKRRVFIPPWCFQYLTHEHAASLGRKRHHINRIHQSGKCLVKRGTQINKQRSDCSMFIYELKVAIDSQMPLPLETGSLWYKPTWHAGADVILNFLHIDSETACALTNQSSSIHLWLTVEAGSQREPLNWNSMMAAVTTRKFNYTCTGAAKESSRILQGYAMWAGIWPSRVPTDLLPPGGTGTSVLRGWRIGGDQRASMAPCTVTPEPGFCSDLILPHQYAAPPPRHMIPAVSAAVCLPAVKSKYSYA